MFHHDHDPTSSPSVGIEPVHHQGFAVPDPFAPRQRPGASFVNALLATALFRCWHILVFFAGWSTLITVLNQQGHKLYMQPTLLTVVGTVLGFIISYRTTSSFERYNEGRRLWSQIILASRTLSRTIWFHVPSNPVVGNETPDQAKARTLIEKKTAINLLEAFSVAIKHYLRGEDGIYYKDLYFLVKFLPAYALPAGMPSTTDVTQFRPETEEEVSIVLEKPPVRDENRQRNRVTSFSDPTSPLSPNSVIAIGPGGRVPPSRPLPMSLKSPTGRTSFATGVFSPRSAYSANHERVVLTKQDESFLMPAHMPPKYGLFDLFPFSLLVKFLSQRGRDVKGKKAARVRAQLKQHAISHNLPLELSLYLSSYIASIQRRKICDVPTTNTLFGSLGNLVDSLTGLERILTTPIPFSYSIHLWLVTYLYCLFLPFQIWTAFHWVTIPATIIVSFIFFGFMVAGEEIENPFGYDKNDLNLDHFTHNIIRNELRAVTSTPPPDPARWAFVPENNLLFSGSTEDRVSPAEWLAKGAHAIERNLGQF